VTAMQASCLILLANAAKQFVCFARHPQPLVDFKRILQMSGSSKV
jgi:hypothetical protein